MAGSKSVDTIGGFQWSASGRYLGWEQWAKSSSAGTVVWYDTLTHQRAQWPMSSYPFPAGWSVTNAGVQAFVPGPDIKSPSEIVSFSTGGTKSTKSVDVPLSDGAAGYSGGFIVGPTLDFNTVMAGHGGGDGHKVGCPAQAHFGIALRGDGRFARWQGLCC